MAEHSLSLSMAPVLVDLAQSLAKDQRALSKLALNRTTASYKLQHGLAFHYSENTAANLRSCPFSLNVDESTSANNKKVFTVLAAYFNSDLQKVVVEHLVSEEVLQANAASLFCVIEKYLSSNNIPWENLVSVLMDSCNVMRGRKGGVEAKLREKCPQLLDIDGDSCHHIHNVAKRFCKPFESFVESLFNDLFNDFRWSTDLRDWLCDICMLLGVKYTMPERYVPHRWLSVFDISVDTTRLMQAYTVFYFGFLHKQDQSLYKERVNEILNDCEVSKQSKIKIEKLHSNMANKVKTLTKEGRARKERIVDKIFFKNEKTMLVLHFYSATLKSLKDYVTLFQSSSTLVFQLHEKQANLFREFLSYFIKPERLSKSSDRELLTIDVEEGNLNAKDVFIGGGATRVGEKMKDQQLFQAFQNTALMAYRAGSKAMQEKLPLNSPVLRALAAIDPLIRGHSFCSKGLKSLGTEHLQHFLSGELKDCLLQEVCTFQVDRTLPQYNNDPTTAVEWWAQVMATGKYKSLGIIITAALSIFHGPMVESSFNVMGDILHAKSSRMNTETYSAIQTVKYGLRSKNTSAIALYGRTDAVKSKVDRTLTSKMSSAAGRYKKSKEKKLQQQNKKFILYKARKPLSKQEENKHLSNCEEESKKSFHKQAASKSRKRALKALSEKYAAKRQCKN